MSDSQVSLDDALERIKGGLRDRAKALGDLVHVLRHYQRDPHSLQLADREYHRLYEDLFQASFAEISAWATSKAGISTSAAESRLSNAAAALRISVELGLRTITYKTAQAVVDHITDSFYTSKGKLCAPLALDYARCLRTLLSYVPHVEHMPSETWNRTVQFCVDAVADLDADDEERISIVHSGPRAIPVVNNEISNRSSKSQLRTASTSQSARTALKGVADELIGCLAHLISCPNAAPACQAQNALDTFVQFLSRTSTVSNSHQHAFAGINSILAWARTDDILLVKGAVGPILRLVTYFWSAKSATLGALKDELVRALLYLRPYICHTMLSSTAVPFQTEVSNLCTIMRSEYGKRPERDQLQLDDLRLCSPGEGSEVPRSISCFVMSLRPTGSKAEQTWVLISLLADLLGHDSRVIADQLVQTGAADDDMDGNRPTKRRKLEGDGQEILQGTLTGSVASRLCCLQIVTFQCQQQVISTPQVPRIVEKLSISCSDEHGSIASWALLALACCASQIRVANAAIDYARWGSIWQLATRLLTGATTSRAASHLLRILGRSLVVQQTAFTELSRHIGTSIDLSGPAVLSDASLGLLQDMITKAQQHSPGSALLLAETVVSWLLRRYSPASFNDKAVASMRNTVQAGDVAQLLVMCLDGTSSLIHERFTPWGTLAQAWLSCAGQADLVAYLLQAPDARPDFNNELVGSSRPPNASAAPCRLNIESLVLGRFLQDVPLARNNWLQVSQGAATSLTHDMLGYACQTALVVASVAHDCYFKDQRRQRQLQAEVHQYLTAIINYAATPDCSQVKVDDLLLTFSAAFSQRCPSPAQTPTFQPGATEILMCGHVRRLLSQRQQNSGTTGTNGFAMESELEDDFESQESHRSRQSHPDSSILTDSSLEFSSAALRANAGLYALVVDEGADRDGPTSGQGGSFSTRFVDYLRSVPTADLLASRQVLNILPSMKFWPEPADTEILLEHCTNEILSPQQWRRSEAGTGLVLTLMQNSFPQLTDTTNRSLFLLGIDMYEWYLEAGAALPASVMQSFGLLLLQLFKHDPKYGVEQNVQSARSSLFKMVHGRSINVLFSLSRQIPDIFGTFVLAEHERIFEDLQENLPSDTDWLEGMAMRLLYLARLGAEWHTILRQCVYYMFETAGQAKEASSYGTGCAKQLSEDLRFASPKKLFRLFAPQLLYTWSEQHSVTSLPFATFSYASLNELLGEHELEVVAQLILRGKEDGLHAVSTALKLSARDLAKRSFAKTAAYCIAWDISQPSSATSASTNEAEIRLRDLVGDKDEFNRLLRAHCPVVIAQSLLSAQQDDAEEKWLEKREAFKDAAKALLEIKGFSCSVQALPAVQQPSFRARYLVEELERICRRLKCPLQDLWTTESFALTVRILLDAVDPALGSLNTCQILRKLRLLVCIAGDVALTGYPLEMLIHTIRPFLSDSHCADDSLGLIQYLLHHGRAYLHNEGLSFLTGTVTVMTLQIRAHAMSRHESTTQESVHRRTVKKMEAFSNWLVDYRRSLAPAKGPTAALQDMLTTALAAVQLPGNAIKGDAASTLLLLLLKQLRSDEAVMSSAHSMEALGLLTRNFAASNFSRNDWLLSDDQCCEYVQGLWDFLRANEVDDGFGLWAATIIGRAYAVSGERPRQEALTLPHKTASGGTVEPGSIRSQAWIAQKLSELSFAPSREHAGLADWTLRCILQSFHDAEQLLAFEQLLPPAMLTALGIGSHGYQPHVAADASFNSPKKLDLQKVCEQRSGTSDRDCFANLAITLCQWASRNAVLSKLPSIFQALPDLAGEFLPYVAHLALEDELSRDSVVKRELSAVISNILADHGIADRDKQTGLLQLLLYLRNMPHPGERTRADRVRWLDVDSRVAAEAAARCGMYTAAVLFVESGVPAAQANRRSSGRASLSQLPVEGVSEEVLRSIFKDMEEPDSYYGVQQRSTLESVLDRLDYEGDGVKSLMFRSAQVDSMMRASHSGAAAGAQGLTRSLASLSFEGLEYALLSGSMADTSDSQNEMLRAARNLQQWDVAVPQKTEEPAAACFAVFQDLSRASDALLYNRSVRSRLLSQLHSVLQNPAKKLPKYEWFTALAGMTEAWELLQVNDDTSMQELVAAMFSRTATLQPKRAEDALILAKDRCTMFSALGENEVLARELHIPVKSLRLANAECLVSVSRLARSNGALQEALAATTHLDSFGHGGSANGISISAAALQETAAVLWDIEEVTASVSMLREILKDANISLQDIPVGRAGVLAELGRELSAARLEKPEDIFKTCLQASIKTLGDRSEGKEAGQVFHQYATFCDQQLQDPVNVEQFSRISQLRQQKQKQVDGLSDVMRHGKTSEERYEAQRSLPKMEAWLRLDNEEYQRQRSIRESYTHLGLKNYLLALSASDEHNISVLRFFAMWLENYDLAKANLAVQGNINGVPSWKFVVITNQLLSRVEKDSSAFQVALQNLVQRLCGDHPYHTLHYLFAATRKPQRRDDTAAQSRWEAASYIRAALSSKGASTTDLLKRWFLADNAYNNLCLSPEPDGRRSKIEINEFPPAVAMASATVKYRVPPATCSIPLRSDARYEDVIIIERWTPQMNIMSGLSRPKALEARASDGRVYKHLFKGARDDDLRQDAIIEQVCEEVSKMLRNHKATRQRDLHIRTYKVIPLTTRSGVIEWVPNSIPIGDWLDPAHSRYFPRCLKADQAKKSIKAVEKSSTEERVETYRNVCRQIPPVMRHFFFETFEDPDEWFQKRTAYTRTTAAVSILGWVIGLGDRHCQNILLDTQTGEAVHIDLGIAFEAGRVLPVPELVPFRLSRDIVDAMGITKTEGVFRRCCEFTLDALREDKDSIMTLLNVLRYDPLYSWTISPMRAKRIQQAPDSTEEADNGEEASSRTKEQEGGEANRALSVVDKKLSKALSTAATVNELIQQATDEKNLARLFCGWSAFW